MTPLFLPSTGRTYLGQSGDDLLLDPHSFCCITNIWQTKNNHDLTTTNCIYPGNTKYICNAPIKFLNKQSNEWVIEFLISFSRERRKRLKIFLVCFSLHSQFIESQEYLYLLGSEPWTRRSAEECRGPRTAEIDCRKKMMELKHSWQVSMTTCTLTDPTSILCMKFSYLWKWFPKKPIYSFLTQEMKMDQIQNPLHCMRDGVSKSILQIIWHDIW